jgi:plasmid stabilization system protein ParE
MRLRWTPAAADDLEHILNYLREHRPDFADATVRELYEATFSLKTSRGPGARRELAS